MDDIGYWRFFTKAATFTIKHYAGLWHAMRDGESLGAYQSPQEAHQALITSSSREVPMRELPKQLSEWPFYPKLVPVSQQKAPPGLAVDNPDGSWLYSATETLLRTTHKGR